MTDGTRCRRPLLLLVAVLVGAAACGDGDGGGEDAGAADSTVSTVSFAEREAAQQLNVAATGMNLVATDVALRARSGGGEHCRTTAAQELEPHRAVLEAAADAVVRQHARAALSDLDRAIAECAAGADGAAVNASLESYRGRFDLLRERIESLTPRR